MKARLPGMFYITGALAFLSVGTVAAQVVYPRAGGAPVAAYQSSGVSPYLNLLRPGNSAGVNYFGMVRPQLDFQNSVQQLQMQQTGLTQQLSTVEGEIPVPVTGHTVQFMNQNKYFMTLNSGGGGNVAPTLISRGRPMTPISGKGQAPQ